MARVPQPGRTKKGAGAGAKLDLSINYYKAADGTGADFGWLAGRDAEGPWELPFANQLELEGNLARIVEQLDATATVAREMQDERSGGRTVWLKAIGAQGQPVPEQWWDESGRDRDQGVDFPYRPQSVKSGDLLVLYAAGTGKVIGVLEVSGEWYEGGKTDRWRYRMDASVRAAKPVSQGLPLETLNVDRLLSKSIRQKSHVRLTDAEAANAMQAFGIAA